MKRLGLILAGLLLCAAPAQSRHWYVSTTGTESSEGTTIGSPTTLNHANWKVVEGDIVHLAGGYYSDPVRPLQGGSADAGKIYYVGTFGIGDSTIVQGGIYCEQPYISISGLTAYAVGTAYGVTISAAHDSLDHVYMPNGVPHPTPTGDYFRIVDCVFEADTLHELAFGEESADKLTGGQTINSSFTLWYTRSGRAAFHCSSTQQLVFTGCDFNITISPTSEGGMWKLYNSSNGVWTDCDFNFTTYRQPTSEGNSSRIRDGSHDNRFLRCNWRWAATTHPVQFLISSTGSAEYDAAQRNNTWYECTFRSAAPSQSPLLYWQAGMRSDSLAYCLVASAYASPLGVNGTMDSSTVVHNTFVKLCPDTVLGSGSPYYTTGNARIFAAETYTGTPAKASDNIFFSVDVHADSLKNSYGAAWSSETNISGGRWGGDYNLWCGELGADSLIYVEGAPTDTASLRSSYSVETHSRFGDPLFIGGTPSLRTALTFDFHLSSASPAIGAGSGGSDIGAYSYAVVTDTFTVAYRSGGIGGSITGDTTQSVPYDSCSTTVEAVPDAHYHLAQWDDSTATAQRFDCHTTRDTTFTAQFAIDSVTVHYASGGHGTVVPAVDTLQVLPYGGDAGFVVALPATGYHFIRWMPDSLANPVRSDTTCVADTTFTAIFGATSYLVTYLAAAHGSIVGSASQWVLYPGIGTAVTARADVGYHFVKWSDNRTDSTRVDTVTTAGKTLTATFTANTYTLTYSAGVGGTITPSASATQSVGHEMNGALVTATASPGYEFYSWSDSLKTASRRELDVMADLSVTAIFNTIYSPAGTAGIALSAASNTLSGPSKTVTVSSTGTAALHVYSVKLYHLYFGHRREVSCTISPATATVAPGDALDFDITGIHYRWRAWPHYRVVVVSDAGTATLDLEYDPC